MTRIRVLAALMLASVAIFSCRYLPYDEQILLTMGTTEKLDLEAKIGPFRIDNFCFYEDGERLVFIPDKENDSSGFIVKSQDNGFAEFRYFTAVDDTFVITNAFSTSVNLANPLKPNGYAETLSGNPGYLAYIRYDYSPDPTPSPMPFLGVIHYNGSMDLYSNGDTNLIYAVDPAISTAAVTVNGAFISPRDNRLYLCATAYDGFSFEFVELNCSINPTGGIAEITQTRPVPFPRNELPILYDFFYNYDISNARSVISYVVPGGDIVNKRWGTLQTEPSSFGVQGQILGRILSNGDILGYKDSAITGFSYSGNQLYRFPMGKLRYVYEKRDPVSGEYRMVFTLITAESDHYSTCDQEYTIYVYSYPTSKVAQLNF